MVINGDTQDLGDHVDMPTVIPIVDEQACHVRRDMVVMTPSFQGPADRIESVVEALVPEVSAELGADWPTGAWLRGLTLDDGEAVLTLAPNLACHGHIVATLAFDVMRRMLPDTDIYVGTSTQ